MSYSRDTGRPKIVLNMIVRNEGKVIERCLAKVKPYIDAWCVVDTGSEDDTVEKVVRVLGDLPGRLHRIPWKNHRDSRNDALDLAIKDGFGEFFLFIDADDTWEAEEGFEWPKSMDADGYYVAISQSNQLFKRVVVASSKKPWRYVQPAHAVLTCEEPHRLGNVHGVCIRMHSDGARRAGPSPEEKYKRDAALLLDRLDANPNDTRAMFYLAQSYRDYGDLRQALIWYDRRANAGGWAEEAFWARYEHARLLMRLGSPFGVVRKSLESAHHMRPLRAEPLHALAVLLRVHENFAGAFPYAAAAKELPYPEDDILFVERDCYDWRALDEYAMACWRIGSAELSLKAHEELLLRPGLPEEQRPRIEKNIDFCRAALRGSRT